MIARKDFCSEEALNKREAFKRYAGLVMLEERIRETSNAFSDEWETCAHICVLSLSRMGGCERR